VSLERFKSLRGGCQQHCWVGNNSTTDTPVYIDSVIGICKRFCICRGKGVWHQYQTFLLINSNALLPHLGPACLFSQPGLHLPCTYSWETTWLSTGEQCVLDSEMLQAPFPLQKHSGQSDSIAHACRRGVTNEQMFRLSSRLKGQGSVWAAHGCILVKPGIETDYGFWAA